MDRLSPFQNSWIRLCQENMQHVEDYSLYHLINLPFLCKQQELASEGCTFQAYLPLNGTKNIVSKPTTVNLGLQVGHLVIRFAEFRPGEEGGTGKGGSWEEKGRLQLTAVKFLGKLCSPLIS